jgi:hypothetical protein
MESWQNQGKVISAFIVSGMRQAYDMEKITGKGATKDGGIHDLQSYEEMIYKRMGIKS